MVVGKFFLGCSHWGTTLSIRNSGAGAVEAEIDYVAMSNVLDDINPAPLGKIRRETTLKIVGV